MIRPLLRLLFVWAILISTARAHVVTQISGEWKPQPGSWEIDILFEAGYAEPDIRDDPAAGAPDRAWLMAQGPEGWARLRREAERYLRNECLQIFSGNDDTEWMVEFPDFKTSPPDFARLLTDGAYLRMVLRPVNPPEGPITLAWRKGEPPTFVLKLQGPDEYLTMDAGDRHVMQIPGVTAGAAKEEASGGSHNLLWTSFSQGYRHVIPQGWDHVLFVIGLFFYRRRWKPLLNQSLAFTAAHTVTLGLAAAGIVKVQGNWVEPMIALSLTAIALENLRANKERDGRARLAVVFGFGLIHGLGFAGALSTWLKPGEGFLPSLLMANLGVEAAQATLLAGAWILTLGWNQSRVYPVVRMIVCIAIAVTGTWWALQRTGII